MERIFEKAMHATAVYRCVSGGIALDLIVPQGALTLMHAPPPQVHWHLPCVKAAKHHCRTPQVHQP
jgi:hypothetical protein